jgi:D123
MPGLNSLACLSDAFESSTRLSADSYEPRAWAPRLDGCTPKTTSLVLPEILTSSLLTGTLNLSHVGVPVPEEDTWYDGTAVSDDDVDDEERLRDGGEDNEARDILAEVCADIDAAIAALGGVVVPKLGTVSPSDATWVSFTRSLRCESAADVLTLIGASERAMKVADNNPPPALALRACIPAVEATFEFRVFVRRQAVVGLSQRDVGVASSLGQSEMDCVVASVVRQFDSVVRDACADFAAGSSQGYAYDVFLDRRWRVWVLDIASWGPPTDALLFTWDELDVAEWMSENCSGNVESNCRMRENGNRAAATSVPGPSRRPRAQLRCVAASSAIRPAQTMYDAMPIELRGVAAGDALAAAAKRMMELREQHGEKLESGESESD